MCMLELLYKHHKEKFISDCQCLIDNLAEAIKKAKEDQYHGSPLRSTLVGSISEHYGFLVEYKDISDAQK